MKSIYTFCMYHTLLFYVLSWIDKLGPDFQKILGKILSLA